MDIHHPIIEVCKDKSSTLILLFLIIGYVILDIFIILGECTLFFENSEQEEWHFLISNSLVLQSVF
jgi:hypothetical protein